VGEMGEADFEELVESDEDAGGGSGNNLKMDSDVRGVAGRLGACGNRLRGDGGW